MKRIGMTLAPALMFAAAPAESAVITYDFSQGGFSGGAAVTGSFTGDDLNMDGQLASFDGEIFDFSASFSGNAIVPAFSFGFDDLIGLVYELGSGFIGDSTAGEVEGIGAETAAFGYLTGPGPLGLATPCDGSDVCGVIGTFDEFDATNALVSVSVSDNPIPEPALWATMILGFGLGGSALRHARRKPAPAAASV